MSKYIYVAEKDTDEAYFLDESAAIAFAKRKNYPTVRRIRVGIEASQDSGHLVWVVNSRE